VDPVFGFSLLKAAALGLVQGLTEFLPVSSSGHLVLFQNIFGMKEPMISFDIALHAGTLIAVFVYLRAEIWGVLAGLYEFIGGKRDVVVHEENPAFRAPVAFPRLWIYILITLIPTGVMAIGGRSFVEAAFGDIRFVAAAWMIMGIALLASLKFHDGKKTMFEMGWQRALMIGVAQAVALFPGISRSGSTILAAMILGIKRDDAAKFSFLIYIPAILGAIVLDIEEGLREVSRVVWEILVGFVVAAVTGYLVIAWLMAIIKQARFFLFGYYCLLLSLVLFIVLELT